MCRADDEKIYKFGEGHGADRLQEYVRFHGKHDNNVEKKTTKILRMEKKLL